MNRNLQENLSSLTAYQPTKHQHAHRCHPASGHTHNHPCPGFFKGNNEGGHDGNDHKQRGHDAYQSQDTGTFFQNDAIKNAVSKTHRNYNGSKPLLREIEVCRNQARGKTNNALLPGAAPRRPAKRAIARVGIKSSGVITRWPIPS